MLAKIGQLDLLRQLFFDCLITPTVAAEYGEALPTWLRVATPAQPHPVALAAYQLDAGEHSALALALELPHCVVLLDDNAARRAAYQLQLEFTGTAGLLVLAKERRIIPTCVAIDNATAGAGHVAQ